MLRITLDIVIPALDNDALSDAILDKLMDNMHAAAMIFFTIATPLVHVDTGMSLGSYLGLANYLSMTLDGLNTRNIYNPLKKYATPPPEFRTPEGGAELSTKEDDLFVVDRAALKVRFNFHSDVYQFKLNNGWGSMEAGAKAMTHYLDTHSILPPDLDKFMTKYYYRTTATGSGSPQLTIKPVRRQKSTRRRP